jgi:glycine betaine catabolism B
VQKYQVPLLDKKKISEDTFEFHFIKPDDFQYIAGQYVIVTIPSLIEKDLKNARHSFTLASSPMEKDLMITTHLTGSIFKKAFMHSSHIEIIGPLGQFTFTGEANAVMLAGGIGITPFRSMNYADGLAGKKIRLFQSDKSINTICYHHLFTELSRKNRLFSYIPTLTADCTWSGEKGRITEKLLDKYIEHPIENSYFICGSPIFVESMQNVLREMAIPIEQIHSDSFLGY